MLSLPNDGRHRTPDAAPQERRQKTLEALTRNVETISGHAPVVLLFEDVHWADPSTLEALGRVVDTLNALRVLLLVTFRHEFVAPWIGRPHVTALTVNRLAPRETGMLIERVARGVPIAENLRRHIMGRADGIPLFVEEMTKAVLEAGGEDRARRDARRPRQPPCLADVAARSSGIGPQRGADRGGDRTGVFVRLAEASDRP